jgi:hypothetical protein
MIIVSLKHLHVKISGKSELNINGRYEDHEECNVSVQVCDSSRVINYVEQFPSSDVHFICTTFLELAVFRSSSNSF